MDKQNEAILTENAQGGKKVEKGMCQARGECCNVATSNIEPYSLSMRRLVVVGVVKSMERNGEKKCDEKIEPSMALPF